MSFSCDNITNGGWGTDALTVCDPTTSFYTCDGSGSGDVGQSAAQACALTCSRARGEGCRWVENNENTAGELYVGDAANEAECIQLVREECPSATIANMELDGVGSCWCQYGDDMSPSPGAGWKSCLLSSVGFEPQAGEPTDDVGQLVESVDTDSDGCISEDEFNAFADQYSRPLPPFESFERAFSFGMVRRAARTTRHNHGPDGGGGERRDHDYAAPPVDTGETVCEGHGYSESECWALGCCQWDPTTNPADQGGPAAPGTSTGACWSSVGDSPCHGYGSGFGEGSYGYGYGYGFCFGGSISQEAIMIIQEHEQLDYDGDGCWSRAEFACSANI